MTQTARLAPWHKAFAGMLSGSVYAARQSARLDTAVAFGQAGLDVHVDIMAVSEGLWHEWDGTGAPNWPAPPDGVLVMLIEPGTRERCALDRLPIVAECAAEMPVTVDGGITEDIAPLCVGAGVKSMVVGRALLEELPAPPGPATTSASMEHHRKEIMR